MIEHIDLTAIRADASAQTRRLISLDTVAEYAERMIEGDMFPPLVVFFDGDTHWLADGFHRHEAAPKAGLTSFPCDIREGGLRDATLYAVCDANVAHGLRRTNEDKRKGVLILLADEEWSRWSDREIARRCKVSAPLVAKLRDESPHPQTFTDRTVSRGGTTYIQNTTAIGRRAAVAASETRHEAFEDKAADCADYGPAAPTPAPAMPDPAKVAKVTDLATGIITAYGNAAYVVDPILEDIANIGARKFLQLLPQGLRHDLLNALGSAPSLAGLWQALARAD